MAISIDEYAKALKSLEDALNAHASQADEMLKEMLRDASIQRFEFCVELAWKVSMKVVGSMNSVPKPAIRDMAQAGLVDDVEKWFKFLEARNRSSHTYDKAVALEVLASASEFLPHGLNLLGRLKTR